MTNKTHGDKPGIVTPLDDQTFTGEAIREIAYRHLARDTQRLTNLRARAASLGFQFHVYDDEDSGQTVFIVSRSEINRQLESLEPAETWLGAIGGSICMQ